MEPNISTTVQQHSWSDNYIHVGRINSSNKTICDGLQWSYAENSYPSASLDQQVYVDLSQKTINRIVNGFHQFGINTHLIMPSLMKIQIPIHCSETVNDKLPKILLAILNKSNGAIEISSDDFLSSVRTLIYLLINNHVNDAVFTIGMGSSATIPSLRLPAYIIPVIKVLKEIRAGNVATAIPKVRVFKATYAGAYVNNLDIDTVKHVTDITLNFLSEFVDSFFPEIATSFYFESDNDYKDSPIYSKILQISKIVSNLTGLDDELTSLRMMGAKHGGNNGFDNAFFYAAAHPLYNQSITPRDIVNSISGFTIANPNPPLIIDFGGRPQKTFNAVIYKLRSNLSIEEYSLPCLINCIIKTGKIPVYYQARKGDKLLSDNCTSIDDFLIDPMTEADYEAIFNEITEHEYLDFIKQFKLKNKI
jgi:hypothetical protein